MKVVREFGVFVDFSLDLRFAYIGGDVLVPHLGTCWVRVFEELRASPPLAWVETPTV